MSWAATNLSVLAPCLAGLDLSWAPSTTPLVCDELSLHLHNLARMWESICIYCLNADSWCEPLAEFVAPGEGLRNGGRWSWSHHLSSSNHLIGYCALMITLRDMFNALDSKGVRLPRQEVVLLDPFTNRSITTSLSRYHIPIQSATPTIIELFIHLWKHVFSQPRHLLGCSSALGTWNLQLSHFSQCDLKFVGVLDLTFSYACGKVTDTSILCLALAKNS